jgi:hypothetical protein
VPPTTPHRDEGTSASPWISPGIVDNDEILLRTLLEPEHVKDGRPVEAAIPLQDLRHRGYSVDRRRYTSKWRVLIYHRSRLRRVGGQRRAFIGILRAHELRQLIAEDTERAFVVIDTALLSNPAHAVILSAIHRSESKARALRKHLARRMTAVALTEAFSDGSGFGWTRGTWGGVPRLL